MLNVVKACSLSEEQWARSPRVSGSNPTTLQIFYGGACTKAGVSPLQGESGGFDFHRLHNRVMVYTEKLYSSIQSEGWCDEDTKYQWRYSTRPVGVVGSIPAVSANFYGSLVKLAITPPLQGGITGSKLVCIHK